MKVFSKQTVKQTESCSQQRRLLFAQRLFHSPLLIRGVILSRLVATDVEQDELAGECVADPSLVPYAADLVLRVGRGDALRHHHWVRE
jgi:hypothetical protein